VDESAAKNSVFGGLVASGWHTAGVTMRLIVGDGALIAGGLIGAGGEIKWPKPTRPGDTLHVVCEVIDVRVSRTRPDRGVVTMRCETRNQRNEAVQIFVTNLIAPRRPASDPG